MITVNHLRKVYTFTAKEQGRGWFSYLLKGSKKEVVAVDNISLSIDSGEAVAFIGPNGAGKSTTIKMLSGILTPTSGEIEVCGLHPSKNRMKLARKIGLVFGQRSQLLWNLPLRDSLVMLGSMYDMTKLEVKKRIDELVTLFQLEQFIDQPVRKLSLGQRMRGEVAASLIHRPELIFLDEPTIGLDVVAKTNLRKALAKLSNEGVTLFVTSHDVGDIETLCPRSVLIDQGIIQYDGSTSDLHKKVGLKKQIRVEHTHAVPFDLPGYVQLKEGSDVGSVYEVDTTSGDLASVIKLIMDNVEVQDMEITNPSLEDVLQELYGKHTT